MNNRDVRDQISISLVLASIAVLFSWGTYGVSTWFNNHLHEEIPYDEYKDTMFKIFLGVGFMKIGAPLAILTSVGSAITSLSARHSLFHRTNANQTAPAEEAQEHALPTTENQTSAGKHLAYGSVALFFALALAALSYFSGREVRHNLESDNTSNIWGIAGMGWLAVYQIAMSLQAVLSAGQSASLAGLSIFHGVQAVRNTPCARRNAPVIEEVDSDEKVDAATQLRNSH